MEGPVIMSTTIVALALAVAATSVGQAPCSNPNCRNHGHHGGHSVGCVVPDGPGYGWGFPNGNPDGYGWWDHGYCLPLGANRTAEYYFPRYFSVPAPQAFLPSYYNPYVTRGQRYIAYTGCSNTGLHPAGGPPIGSALTPVHPYQDTIGSGPQVNLPAFRGRVEAPPVNSGSTGLTP
jgi:hypothetical protein